jgi:hypothetical protein
VPARSGRIRAGPGEAAAKLHESLGHHVELASFRFDYDAFLLANLRIWTTFLAVLVDQVARTARRTPR